MTHWSGSLLQADWPPRFSRKSYFWQGRAWFFYASVCLSMRDLSVERVQITAGLGEESLRTERGSSTRDKRALLQLSHLAAALKRALRSASEPPHQGRPSLSQRQTRPSKSSLYVLVAHLRIVQKEDTDIRRESESWRSGGTSPSSTLRFFVAERRSCSTQGLRQRFACSRAFGSPRHHPPALADPFSWTLSLCFGVLHSLSAYKLYKHTFSPTRFAWISHRKVRLASSIKHATVTAGKQNKLEPRQPAAPKSRLLAFLFNRVKVIQV